MDNKNLRTKLIVLTALVLPIASWADESAVYEVNLEPQPLSDALKSFADQTGLQVMFFSEVTDGVETNALNGDYTADAALDTLLASTGLTYDYINDKAVTVRAIDNASESPRGDSDSKNSRRTPVLLTQNRTSRALTTEGNRSEEGGTSVVTGKVTDARTGANLKGALISVRSTGQSTRTDDLGRFRIVGVPAGEQSIAVSFLGYAPDVIDLIVQSGVASDVAFSLQGGSDVEEIVVYGQRSARARALNQERTALNVSTVISSDVIGAFNGTTISDVLRRAPGVAFQQNGLTGEGTNVIVRGLAPDLNTVTLNGVELPVGDGLGRSASLNNILVDSIESVTISKTLLPAQDSAGTGGLVEIRTKSPLDRDRRFASLLIEGAQRGSDFSEDLAASATISGVFGEKENFGLSASVQYRELSNSNVSYSQSLLFGQHLPLEADGSTAIRSRLDIDPRIAFPYEDSAENIYAGGFNSSFNSLETENLAFTLSAEWAPVDSTTLALDFTRSTADAEQLSRNSGLGGLNGYDEIPIQSLDGEVRRGLQWANGINADQNYTFEPVNESDTEVLSFRGETNSGTWDFGYEAGYTKGETSSSGVTFSTNNSLNTLDSSFLLPSATDPIEGRVITLFGERVGDGIQLPLLTQAGFDLVNDPGNYAFSRAIATGASGENERYTAGGHVRKSFNRSRLRSIELGIDYEVSSFEDSRPDARFIIGNTDLASLGLDLEATDLSRIGIDGGFNVIAEGDVTAFLAGVFDLAETEPGLILIERELPPLLRETSTEETEVAPYFQAELAFGDFELIGGVRVSIVEVEARNLSSPIFIDANGVRDIAFSEEFARLVTQTDETTNVLPRFLLNYRPSESIVFRGGYFLSVARPEIGLLSDDQSVNLNLQPEFGPNDDQPQLTVVEGNPGLKPAKTHNFDFSAELYFDDIGVLKLGLFYKSIDDFIQSQRFRLFDDLSGVILPDDERFQNLPDNLFVEVRRPVNSEDEAEIWGLEAAFERQLTFLPGIWDGLGVFANYTYTDSSKVEPFSWGAPVFDETGAFVSRESAIVEFDDVRFDQQPDHSGTAAVTYNKYGIDASLAYSYQDRYQVQFVPNGQSVFLEDVDTLDVRVEYRFDRGSASWRLFFEGSDLLKGTNDADRLGSIGDGAISAVNVGNYLGGRVFRLGFGATF